MLVYHDYNYHATLVSSWHDAYGTVLQVQSTVPHTSTYSRSCPKYIHTYIHTTVVSTVPTYITTLYTSIYIYIYIVVVRIPTDTARYVCTYSRCQLCKSCARAAYIYMCKLKLLSDVRIRSRGKNLHLNILGNNSNNNRRIYTKSNYSYSIYIYIYISYIHPSIAISKEQSTLLNFISRTDTVLCNRVSYNFQGRINIYIVLKLK